ncbi:MAG: PD-(D/E)XK nuclease-like domain-containing protein [Phycisphaerales bacterium]
MNTEPIDLGFLIREPADVYHAKAKDNLSSHWLAEFARCPLLYHKKRIGLIPQRDSAAFLVGRAAHTLILEGRERYESEYAVGGPVNPKTGNPYGSGTKAFAQWAEKIGKPVLSDDQAALIEQMAASVKGHIFARELLADGVAEGVVRCRVGGHECQARLDWINPVHDRGIVDLKTTDSLDGFELDISAYRYVEQLAFYRALVAEVTGRNLPVHIIAVEKREPFRCGVWVISDKSLTKAQRDNDSAMAELARCQRRDHWPTRFESIRQYDRLTH